MKRNRRYWMDEAMMQHDVIGILVGQIVDMEGVSRDDREWGRRFVRVLEDAEKAAAPQAQTKERATA